MRQSEVRKWDDVSKAVNRSREGLTSVKWLLAVEAALTALTFREWLEGRGGDAVGDVLESLNAPSAVLFTEERAP